MAEDAAQASFAGQLQTCLNVPAEHVVAAVLAVWRSAEAAHVAAYQQRLGHGTGGLAVVIQAMVSAVVSGVIFTADPLSGASERLVINAAWGLGEGVVSGSVTPDHWVVARSTKEVLECRIGEKSRMVVADNGQGTRVVPTPLERTASPALTPEQIPTLTQLALRVEQHFGAPQDIEWAYGDGRFWILQARPITAQPGTGWVSEFDSDTHPETVWTAANIQEVLPGLLTPLTWSFLQPQWRYAYQKVFLRTHTLRDPAIEFVALFYNRPFLNVSALRHVAARAIGTSPEAVDEQYLGTTRAPEQPKAPLTWQRLLAYLDTTPRTMWMLCRTPQQVRKMTARVRLWLAQQRQQPLASLGLEALLASLRRADAVDREVGALHIATTSGASVGFESLQRLLIYWCGDEATTLLPALTTGLQDIPSAAPGLEMAELAAMVQPHSALHAALLAPDPWANLQALPGAAATAFRARLARFLGQYGHRSVMEWELATATWAEEPHSVLLFLRNFLHMPPEASANQVAARQEAYRLAATTAVDQRLGLLRRWVFRLVVHYAQTYVKHREHTKALWIEVNHVIRRLCREVGQRLVAQGRLADAQDLYFLTFAEVQQLSTIGIPDMPVSTRIRRRQAEFVRNQQVTLPESFQGRPRPLLNVSAPGTGGVLRGIPVSPGVVTGLARVIRDPRSDTVLQPGEILIAPVTDAGWGPLFLIAAGVVVDVGGPLSHGAIVAREYGVPAVVNVKEATRLVRTGQTITVNGTTGEVWVE
jgi:pyruvate,water dikinase